MNNFEFLRAFENCELPEAEWTHTAHVRMAWIYLNYLPFDEALHRIRAGIQRYNAKVLRRPDAYHETITQCFATLIAQRLEPGESWIEFFQHNPVLFNSQSSLLLFYYSKARLNSQLARHTFVLPDRRSLPVAVGSARDRRSWQSGSSTWRPSDQSREARLARRSVTAETLSSFVVKPLQMELVL